MTRRKQSRSGRRSVSFSRNHVKHKHDKKNGEPGNVIPSVRSKPDEETRGSISFDKLMQWIKGYNNKCSTEQYQTLPGMLKSGSDLKEWLNELTSLIRSEKRYYLNITPIPLYMTDEYYGPTWGKITFEPFTKPMAQNALVVMTAPLDVKRLKQKLWLNRDLLRQIKVFLISL